MDYYSRTRKRDFIDSLRGQSYSYNGTSSGLPSSSTTVGTIVGGETTSDNAFTNWRFYRELVRKGKLSPWNNLLDVGGPFLSVKYLHEYDGTIYDAKSVLGDGAIYARYLGVQLPIAVNADWKSPNNPWQKVVGSTDNQLDALGTTAIARVAPTNPHASALNAMVELYRDGLPHAIGLKAIRREGGLSDEYLNYEFGILPTISDIKAISESYSKADKLLSQYYRDSGRVVRRRYAFPSTVEVISDTSSTGQVPSPALNGNLYRQVTGTLRKVTTVETRQWFSGAFTYHAKPPNSVFAIRDQVEKYNYLYGINPSPSVIWNGLPWSWAADWVTNVGDVVNNLVAFSTDGLVMRYGYMMEEIHVKTEYTHTGTVLLNAGPVHARQSFTTVYKRRRKATPYGFGLELSGFTDRQWAILAALGISRGRGAL